MSESTADRDVLSVDVDIKTNDIFSASGVNKVQNENAAQNTNKILPAVSAEEKPDRVSNTMPSRLKSDFIVENELGRGGFGTVFKVKNKFDGLTFAIKEIIIEDNEQSRQKALREVRTLARCHHKNIVRYIQTWPEDLHDGNRPICREPTDFGVASNSVPTPNETKSLLYIQMELCDVDLEYWIDDKKKKSFDLNERLHIFREILQGVTYIHENGFIHRDLKPSNILFGLDGNWKIGDFGLAAEVFMNNTNEISIAKQYALHTKGAGTRLYMAPEQIRKPNYTTKVDIFSMGLIFYELLSVFKSQKIREKTFKSLRKGDFPETFQNDHPTEYSIIKEMVSHSAKDRPNTGEIQRRLSERFDLLNQNPNTNKKSHRSRFHSNYEVRGVEVKGPYKVVFLVKDKHKMSNQSYTIERIVLPKDENKRKKAILKAEELANAINDKNMIRCVDVWVEDVSSNWQNEQDDHWASRFRVECIDLTSSPETSLSSTKTSSYLYTQLDMCEKSLETYLQTVKKSKIYEKRPVTRKGKCNSIFKQIIYALKKIHRKHAHGNLKLDNIFLAANDSIKVGHFGLLKTSKTDTNEGNSSSSSDYTSDYAIDSNSHRKEDDIYSLGEIYYKLFFVIQKNMEYNEVSELWRTNKFPDNFQSDFPKEYNFMMGMLAGDPKNRLEVGDIHKRLIQLEK